MDACAFHNPSRSQRLDKIVFKLVVAPVVGMELLDGAIKPLDTVEPKKLTSGPRQKGRKRTRNMRGAQPAARERAELLSAPVMSIG